MSRFWDRWPLTLVGLILIGWASANLTDQDSIDESGAVVLGLGVFLLGAGTALVILGIGRNGHGHDDKDPPR